mgnify:CR=1 FL=1
MCGIALVGGPCAAHDGVWPPLVRAIARRGTCTAHPGPDALAHTTVTLGGHTARLAASVLGLRGAGVTQQPLRSDDAHLLFAWNGEVFASDRAPIPLAENDAAALFARILAHGPNWEDALVTTLAHVEGPYAFLLIDVRRMLTKPGRTGPRLVRPRPARPPLAPAHARAGLHRFGRGAGSTRGRPRVRRSAVRDALAHRPRCTYARRTRRATRVAPRRVARRARRRRRRRTRTSSSRCSSRRSRS